MNEYIKFKLKSIYLISTVALLMGSCATIIGGSRINAHISVDRPNAKIIYDGEVQGTGKAIVTIKRSEINRFKFSVKEEGCEEQKYEFQSRTFRGWAFVGTIATWTGMIGGVPLPWGVGVDLATGALWKPNVWEDGVSKIDYKNYEYEVKYTNCTSNISNISQLQDFVYLKNGSIIKGLIIEQIPNSQIKIQTKDGSIFVFKMDEIEKITKEIGK